MSHNHQGHHHHHAAPESYNLSFALAFAFNMLFIFIEVIYALNANSMSLLADAGHNLGDVLSLVLAWVANWLANKNASERYSYGFKKSTILASLLNALLLVAASAIISYESIYRLIHLTEVHEITVITVALIAIVVNGGTALLFVKGRHDDLNIKGTFIHLASDALISLGVVFASILIYITGFDWLDPVTSLIIVVVILLGTWGLLMDSVNLIIAGVPRNIDSQAVIEYLKKIPGVSKVHDLHIWGLSTRENALTAHLIMPKISLTDDDYRRINKEIAQQFSVQHVTLQIETGNEDDPCGQTYCC